MGNSQHKDGPKPQQNKFVARCQRICPKALAIALCVVVIITAGSEIGVAVTNGLATKLYSSDLSGRLVAMAVLALTAAVTLASCIYAMVGFIKKKKKPLHVSGVVLFVMAIIQALLCGIAIKVTSHDEATLSNSLAKSFNQGLEGQPRHYKMWAITQHAFECCGLNGPDDYLDPMSSGAFGPNVPISCCWNYQPGRSDLLQEKELAVCRARKEYYLMGCGGLVKAGFRNSASAALSVTIAFIALEVILAAICWVAYRLYLKREKVAREKDDCSAKVVVLVNSDQGTQDKPATGERQGHGTQGTPVTQDTQVAQTELQMTVDEKEHS